MTPFPYSVDMEDDVSRALEMMAEHDIRHLPVKEAGQLVSVITDRDIARIMDSSADGTGIDQRKVRQGCEQEVYIVDLTERLDAVLLHMAKAHIDCTLVTRQGRLAGIFTIRDACRCFGEWLQNQFLHGNDNDAA